MIYIYIYMFIIIQGNKNRLSVAPTEEGTGIRIVRRSNLFRHFNKFHILKV